MGAEQDRDTQGFAEDLELSEAEARSVKGGVLPIEGGDAGSSGFSLSASSWKMRRRAKKKNQSSSGSSAGGRPV